MNAVVLSGFSRVGNDLVEAPCTRRVRPLGDTIDRVLGLRDVLGITRIGETTHLDVLGVPNVSVVAPGMNFPPQPGIISVFSGKGPTLDHAMASALMETAERYCGRSRSEHLVVGSLDHLVRRHPVVPASSFIAPGSHLVADSTPIEWVWARHLWSDQPALVPAWLTYTPYLPSCRDLTDGPRCSTTNGLASGNTFEEAILHALYELIERDAEALAFAGGRSVTVDLDSVDSPAAKDLIERYRGAGIELQVRDITQDTDVPTFLAMAIDPALPKVNYVNGGKGTHLDPEIALVRALTEVAQSRVIEMAGIREDMSPRTSLVEADFASFLEKNRRWYCNTDSTVAWGQYRSNARTNVVDDIETVRRRLARVGIEHAFVVDLTRPEVGIPVARVLCPGLEHDVGGAPVGPRAERIAVTAEMGGQRG